MTTSTEKQPKMQAINYRTKQNADGIGVGGSVVLIWLSGMIASRYGIEIPPEVFGALATMIGGFAARFKDN